MKAGDVPGKETVVRRDGAGWAFQLPEQHTAEVSDDQRYVSLSSPFESSTYLLVGVEEGPEEVTIALGGVVMQTGPAYGGRRRVVAGGVGYPLPAFQHELVHLREKWDAAGLSPQRFDAFAQGTGWVDGLSHIRSELRAHDRGDPSL